MLRVKAGLQKLSKLSGRGVRTPRALSVSRNSNYSGGLEVKRNIGKLITGVFALALLLGGFGMFQSTAQAQSATMTVVPVALTDVATENTTICAKCGGDDAKFKITVTDSTKNANAGYEDTITVTVKNLELGTLGTLTTPDSNPKTITLIETGHATGIFERVVTGVNATATLVQDKIAGTSTGGSTTTVIDAPNFATANLNATNRAAIIGGILQITSGGAAPEDEVQPITGFTDANGTVTTTVAFSAATANTDTFVVYPLVNHPVFTGQTLEISYAQAGSLGQSKTITNEEVKPTLLIAGPAGSLVTKAAKTVTFSATATDTGAGFPAKAQDVVDNNAAGKKGRIQLFVGTAAVTLTAANYTAITDGWQLSADFNSTDIASIAGKVAWWIQAEDLAGNVQEPSESHTGTTTSAGNGGGTTLVDTALIGMVANSLVGRTITISISGVDVTKTVSAYATGTGTVTVSAAYGAQIAAATTYKINKTQIITVDGTAPTLSATVTGDSWSATKAAGSRLRQTTSSASNGSNSSIRVTFTDASGMDTATIVPSAFSVADNTVSSVLLVDVIGENAATVEQRIPNDVFLTLGTALVSSAKPKVTISSSITDKAGNAFAGTTATSTDKIGPTLAVTLGATLSKKEIKTTIVSDELLISAPTVATKVMSVLATGALQAIGGALTNGGAAAGSVAQSGTLTYTQTTKIASLGAAAAGAEFNVYVTANDTGASSGNQGVTGHSTNATSTSAITYELDQWLNKGTPPRVDVGATMTDAATAAGGTQSTPSIEQIDPLIVTIDFNKGCTAGNACAGAGEGAEYIGDSHKTVALTSASVKVTFADGTTETTTYDVALDVTTPDSKRFTLPIQAPKVGVYALTIKAVDAAGNDNLKAPTAASAQGLVYNFEVKAASPVKLSLSPGWNLISLPFQPSNPAINSVIPTTHPIDLVMAYDNVTQVWLVSRRGDDLLFGGDVAVMTSTTAYFVRTSNFEELSLLQPPLATSAAAPPPPPAISVVEGWNLVPVVSLAKPLPTEVKSDTYFGTLGVNWLKAMTYNPLTRVWSSVTRATAHATLAAADPVLTSTNICGVTTNGATGAITTVDATVCIGKGYWLYASKAGVIIP